MTGNCTDRSWHARSDVQPRLPYPKAGGRMRRRAVGRSLCEWAAARGGGTNTQGDNLTKLSDHHPSAPFGARHMSPSPSPSEMSRPLAEIKAELFKALAHPARVRALEVLSEGEHTVGELQPRVGIESSHLSQQLGVLRRAGLVATRKEGSSVYYSLRDPLVADLLAVAKQLLLATLTQTHDLLAELHAEVGSG